MEFRRMNNGSVRCLISEEDMQEHGLEVTDFLNDRDKVHEFLEIVIEREINEEDHAKLIDEFIENVGEAS